MPTNLWYNRVNASALGDDARELSALLPTVGVSGGRERRFSMNSRNAEGNTRSHDCES